MQNVAFENSFDKNFSENSALASLPGRSSSWDIVSPAPEQPAPTQEPAKKYAGGVGSYSKAFWEAVRKTILEKKGDGTWVDLAKLLGTSGHGYRKFVQGHASALTEASLDVLRNLGWVTKEMEALQDAPPQQEDSASVLSRLAREAEQAATTESAPTPAKEIAAPAENWTGETKSTAQAAEEKGYSASTIRAWCKSGKINYVKVGKKYMVCVDEKYAAIAEKEIAKLRKENKLQAQEIERLNKKIASMQLEWNFDKVRTQYDPATFCHTQS